MSCDALEGIGWGAADSSDTLITNSTSSDDASSSGTNEVEALFSLSILVYCQIQHHNI